MACDLATVLLALKLANGQIPREITLSTTGTTVMPLPNSSASLADYPTTTNQRGGTTWTLSNEEAARFHEARAKQIRDDIAAEKKRKDDRAFIDKTLKECGKQK